MVRIMAGKEFPESYEGWEAAARSALDDEKFSYIVSTAGRGETARANLEAFRRWKVVPRVLRDVRGRSSAMTLLGTSISAPILLSPVRGLGYIRGGGDESAARAAASLGVPLVVSTFATIPIERISQVMGRAPRWFQLYPGTDRDILGSLVRRAEASGYSAIVVTVDKADNYPHYNGPGGHEFERHGHEVYFSDPVFGARFGGSPERHFEEAWRRWKEIRLAPGLALEELHSLTTVTKMPVLVKGVLNPEDAVLAVEQGAAGIVVSNHGGRSLDGEVASLDALVEIRKRLKPGFPVLLDSGVRSGTDVLKALALGADAVMVGKMYTLALGVGGEKGVKEAIGGLIREFQAAMALCGVTSPKDIDRSMVVRATES